MAEDVEKKFRVGLSIGTFNSLDEISSDSANVLLLTDEQFLLVERFIDPRSDSSVFGNLDINPGFMITASGQYALSKIFLIEASVGYQKTDVGDVEVQGQFEVNLPITLDFDFRTFRIPVGELERVPIRITALARFRPRASFNPYAGLGIGYTLIGLEPTDEFNQLSRNMDASLGAQAGVSSALFGNPDLVIPSPTQIGDLTGATLDARDTFEWHLAGGGELSIRRHWALFLDVRFTMSSRSLSVGFNGGKDLGRAVPQLVDFEDSPAANQEYGPVQITAGGLLDAGSYVPKDPNQDPAPACTTAGEDGVFDFTAQDGKLDTGFYYAQGGSIDYGGVSLEFGFRYTF